MVSPDGGDRYLETVYDATWLSRHGFDIFESEALERAILALPEIPFHEPRQ